MATANNEFFEALAALEKERGLPEDYLVEKIKAAIVIAVKKDYEVEDDNVMVEIDPATGKFNVALLQVGLVVESVDLLGDVGEDAFRSPVRNTHHVTGENVRKGIGLGSTTNLAFHIVVRNDFQLDLVLVGGVVGLHRVLGLTLQRRTGPQSDLSAVISAGCRNIGRSRRSTTAGTTAACSHRNKQRGCRDAGNNASDLVERHHVYFFLYVSLSFEPSGGPSAVCLHDFRLFSFD